MLQLMIRIEKKVILLRSPVTKNSTSTADGFQLEWGFSPGSRLIDYIPENVCPRQPEPIQLTQFSVPSKAPPPLMAEPPKKRGGTKAHAIKLTINYTWAFFGPAYCATFNCGRPAHHPDCPGCPIRTLCLTSAIRQCSPNQNQTKPGSGHSNLF